MLKQAMAKARPTLVKTVTVAPKPERKRWECQEKKCEGTREKITLGWGKCVVCGMNPEERKCYMENPMVGINFRPNYTEAHFPPRREILAEPQQRQA